MACEPKGQVGTMPTDNGLEAMSALLPENAGSHKKNTANSMDVSLRIKKG